MRDSEELAFALYRAQAALPQYEYQPIDSWDDLNEEAQERYLAMVNAAFEWLFEHGRISQYINVEQLEEASKEYRAYLETGNQKNAI